MTVLSVDVSYGNTLMILIEKNCVGSFDFMKGRVVLNSL